MTFFPTQRVFDALNADECIVGVLVVGNTVVEYLYEAKWPNFERGERYFTRRALFKI